jgi:hypothetical protein
MTICRISYQASGIVALTLLTLTVCMPLRADNFAEFDRIATGLRDSSARTPAGTWPGWPFAF